MMGGTVTAPSGHAVRNLIRGVSARFAEKPRGVDHGEGRRVPRRHSYDVDDLRAQPWKKVGDGSHAQGVIHREALMQSAKEQRRQDWQELPNRRLRDTRAARGAGGRAGCAYRTGASSDRPAGNAAA